MLDVLHIHRQPFEAVRHLEARERHRDAADLLEIGELPDLHAVAPDFPAEAPGSERRALPIVLDEAEVVAQRIEADLAVAREQQLLGVVRARLDDDLVLVIVLQPVRVLAVAAVARRRLGCT